jgi:hypothetical protein
VYPNQGGNMSTPAIRAALERLLQHIDDPSYTAFAHGYTIAAVRAFMAAIDDLLTAVSAAYSAHGWVANEKFIPLLEDVARLAGIVEDGWDASASPGDTKAKTPTALDEPDGEGPSAVDLLPVNPPNIPTTIAMQYRSAWREGVEDGWNEARAVLTRWGRPIAPPAGEASNFDPRLIALATTSEQIPPGPYSEHELQTQWDAQADEHNQWESLDSSEQLAWAQARAIAADRNGRPAAPPAPEAGDVGEFELTPREVEAQEAFTQLRDELLNLLDGVEVNEVLGIIDNHTPEWV